jgi:hypothetical protein
MACYGDSFTFFFTVPVTGTVIKATLHAARVNVPEGSGYLGCFINGTNPSPLHRPTAPQPIRCVLTLL